MNILSLHIVIPILTILVLLLAKDSKQARSVAAAGMIMQLIVSITLMIQFFDLRSAGETATVLFEESYVWYQHLNIEYHTGVDGIGVFMIVLTSIVMVAGVFASWGIEKQTKEFFIFLLLLSIGAYGFFMAVDLFTMFVYYELAVIPLYLLIGIWGSGKKEYAAMKLTLMLMGGSALLLVGLLGIYYYSGASQNEWTYDMLKIAAYDMPVDKQYLFFPLVFIGFGVIGALFPFHSWSPDGHSSAPTATSMLHAGVVMKLGGYGCLKVGMMLMPEAAHEMTWIFMTLAIAGVVYGAYVTLLQTDLKYINAFSSVSHCSLVLMAILMFNRTATTGAIMQMLSHGLMTALFFGLIGMIYARTGTRDIREMGGLIKSIPFLGACYIIAGLCSLGLPGLSGFAAEVYIFVGSFQEADMFHRIVTILAASSIVVTAVYILRVVGRFLLGPVTNEKFLTLKDAAWHEKIVTVMLVIAVFGMGMAPGWIADSLGDSIEVIFNIIEK